MKEKTLADIAFELWVKICIKMIIALMLAIVLFVSIQLIFSVSQARLFVGIFVIFWVIGGFFVYSEFKKFAIQSKCEDILPSIKNSILKAIFLYISLTFRALILLIPLIGILVFFSKGDIIGRIYAIVFEFLVGYPSIYWYLKGKC